MRRDDNMWRQQKMSLCRFNYMKMDLFEFLVEHLSAKRIQINPNTGRELFIDDYGRKTDACAYDEASRELKDLKARFLRPDGNKRDYRYIFITLLFYQIEP